MIATRRPRLPAYAGFAAVLSGAGLPIYIHAPKVYSDTYGVGAGALGLVLGGLRLVDVVQDPALGWLSVRIAKWRGIAVAVAAAVMASAMMLLFAVPPPVAPLAWFALTLTLLFSGFSFLSITFYANGVTAAGRLGPNGHVRLAAWRESGTLLGVSLAALAPTVLALVTGHAFAAYAFVFAGLTAVAAIAMRGEWSRNASGVPGGLDIVLSDPASRRLLVLALVNAAPVAVTSTLFLFFVDLRLGAPEWGGPLLLLFFLTAAASAPLWGRLAQRRGPRRALLSGMLLAVAAFAGVVFLSEGDVLPFALICAVSGAAVGADFTLLPAMFASRLADISPEAGAAFGLWSFVSKAALALAAVTVLPVLDWAGFDAGANQTSGTTLVYLTVLYGVLPCLLKIAAILLLLATPVEDD